MTDRKFNMMAITKMVYKTKLLKLIVILIISSTCEAKKYENFTLFRGIPTSDPQLEFLRNLSNLYDMNYWTEPGTLQTPVDFVISPNDKDLFMEDARRRGVELTTIMEDVQSAFDRQSIKSYIRRKMDSFDWHNFYRLQDIYSWLYDLEKAYPKEVKVETIGRTHEKRPILAVSVTLEECLHRSRVIIEGGIHAREWIAPAFVTYMLHQILNSALSENKQLVLIARTYEWSFIPVVNPDGYEYTHVEDRLWRKNRNNAGVDLNRNFGFAFGSEGVSFHRDSETYCGDEAFSEKESYSMKQFIKTKSGSLEYYFGFHSYGQFMIIPYAHSKKHMENYDEMKQMTLGAADKIKSFYGTAYTVGTAYDTVGYKVSGSSTCWVKNTFAVPYVLTFELRDTGSYGFALPADQIMPTCEETLAGVLYLLTPNEKRFRDMKIDYMKSKLGWYENVFDGQGQKVFDKIVITFYVVCITLQFV